jgi:hypothetical protein
MLRLEQGVAPPGLPASEPIDQGSAFSAKTKAAEGKSVPFSPAEAEIPQG